MSFGISKKSMEMILSALMQTQEIEKAFIFGSRSMGNYKNGSDIDMVIYGINITSEILNRISIELNEKLPLPYYFDIVHYEALKHESLKEHIDKFGKNFYSRRLKNDRC